MPPSCFNFTRVFSHQQATAYILAHQIQFPTLPGATLILQICTQLLTSPCAILIRHFSGSAFYTTMCHLNSSSFRSTSYITRCQPKSSLLRRGSLHHQVAPSFFKLCSSSYITTYLHNSSGFRYSFLHYHVPP